MNEMQRVPSFTIRNVPEEVHRALRVRAAMQGRSTEAEIRDILEKVVRPEGRVKLGSILASISHEASLSDEDVAIFSELRDKTPAEPARFG